MEGRVIALARDREHRFSKHPVSEIELIVGSGVQGDAHAGASVKHRSRVALDPTQPNLRQVHLIHAELFDDLRRKGYDVGPADLGEYITTSGIDLLALPRHTVLAIGEQVELQITGLRNPCAQIDRFQRGLVAAVLDRGPDNRLVRKAGIMSIVKSGGIVRTGDRITIILPALPHLPLECV